MGKLQCVFIHMSFKQYLDNQGTLKNTSMFNGIYKSLFSWIVYKSLTVFCISDSYLLTAMCCDICFNGCDHSECSLGLSWANMPLGGVVKNE